MNRTNEVKKNIEDERAKHKCPSVSQRHLLK